MLQSYWLALGAFGTLMFLLWTVVQPHKRVRITASASAFAYGIMALRGPAVETWRCGQECARQPTPAEWSVQLFVGGLAVLSLIAVIGYHFEFYPPEGDRE